MGCCILVISTKVYTYQNVWADKQQKTKGNIADGQASARI